MTVADFLAVLVANPGVKMHFMLPDGSFIPAHYHITEVGRVQKDFIDCGGTVRSKTSCVLQVWVATDVDHRLETTKLAKIIDIARPLLQSDDLPVEVEYEDAVVSQYPLGGAEVTPSGLLFTLGTKHTACLAPETCGVGGEGCCAAPEPKRILFVCIHNSARSQMAEAFVNQMCSDSYEAHSAGLEPGVLNPLVVEAMREVGIDIATARTKSVAEMLAQGPTFERVVTVCDEASAERCPTFPGGVQREHWGFPDPSALAGTHEERLLAVRTIRDDIRQRISQWCRLACTTAS
jgi:thioredoxin type arsenate reductase